MPEVIPNVGADPINPAYYAGTACAEIIEHMPTNVGFAAKYAWRLGEKDSEAQEAGKAIWYLRRQLNLTWHDTGVDFGFYTFGNNRIEVMPRLDPVRAEIIGECIAYTVDGAVRHLVRAIQLFKTYIGEQNEDHEQQRD
jgi:hypothetical protein